MAAFELKGSSFEFRWYTYGLPSENFLFPIFCGFRDLEKIFSTNICNWRGGLPQMLIVDSNERCTNR